MVDSDILITKPPAAVMGSELQSVTLEPFQKTLFQHYSGQKVTTASQELMDYTITHFNPDPLDVLEIGSGSGIMTLMLSLHRPQWVITGLEIQKGLHELSLVNWDVIKSSGVQFIRGDVRISEQWLGTRRFDLIISNPPYYRLQDGRRSPVEEIAYSNHEVSMTMDDLILALGKHIKPGGCAVISYPMKRIDEFKRKIKDTDWRIREETLCEDVSNPTSKTRMIVELRHVDH